MTEPTVYLMLAGSAIARDERGEILETVDFDASGKPDWTEASICDYRGGGGKEGFDLLVVALDAAEKNARLLGYDELVRVP